MLGLDIVPLPSDERGNVDLVALRELCDDRLAGLMLTNPPNTLGLFDENVAEVIKLSTKLVVWSMETAPT